jgi:Flp pilus assembly pilin Flp
MNTLLRAVWTEDDGVLSFEWVLLITVLVIGIVGGLAAARDAIIDELGDVAQALLALDQTYDIDHPLAVGFYDSAEEVVSTSSNSSFLDDAQFSDCERSVDVQGQGTIGDVGD